MAFCPHCGQEVFEGAKFCPNCGKDLSSFDQTVRRQSFQGEFKKCPSCGAELRSFTAICPTCGFELNSIKVSESIKEFSEILDQYDAEIAKNPHYKAAGGWSTWGTAAKVMWVILNIYTFCIPIIISNNRRGVAEKNPDKVAKASFITNYVFPNERESLIEALLFAKNQMISLINGKINGDTAFWENVWASKAASLMQKIQLSVGKDEMAIRLNEEINRIDRVLRKKLLAKKILIIAIIVALFLWALAY